MDLRSETVRRSNGPAPFEARSFAAAARRALDDSLRRCGRLKGVLGSSFLSSRAFCVALRLRGASVSAFVTSPSGGGAARLMHCRRNILRQTRSVQVSPTQGPPRALRRSCTASAAPAETDQMTARYSAGRVAGAVVGVVRD